MTDRPHPTSRELFLGFFSVGINGFGGVMPWARRMIVDQRRWLSADEFIDALAMCQFLPGPNIVNLAVVLGSRFRGPLGSASAVLGILLAPMAIVIAAYSLLGAFASDPVVVGALHGLAAAGAALVASMACKLALPAIRRRDIWALLMGLVAVVAVAVFRLPLIVTLLVLAPVAVAGCRRARR